MFGHCKLLGELLSRPGSTWRRKELSRKGKSWSQHDLHGSLGYERVCKGRGRCQGSGGRAGSRDITARWMNLLGWGTDRLTLPRPAVSNPHRRFPSPGSWVTRTPSVGGSWSAERKSVPRAVQFYFWCFLGFFKVFGEDAN